jgi:hypothetical protein
MQRRSASLSRIPLLATVCLTLATAAPVVHAQDAAPYTLHVYTNLVQLPTLVLSEDRKLLPPIKRERFAISLDQGPSFQPTQMRIEGDDPISLAVLLDVSGGHEDIVAAFAKAFPKLAPQFLHPKDRVSIYAIDCALIRSSTDIPADSDVLKAGIAAVLAAPDLHGAQQHGACASSVHLWDAVAKLSGTLGQLPGRRVLLVLSNGWDGKSTISFSEANTRAIRNSVAIFGIRDWVEYVHARQFAAQPFNRTQLTIPAQVGDPVSHEDLFDLLCVGNGGITFNLSQRDVAKSLQTFVAMVRGRYILEYPRPDVAVAGLHYVTITVPGTHDFVQSTGIVYPTADPALLKDPSTVHTTPSPATFGPRRPIDPH